MEWLFIALAIAALSLLQGDGGETITVCALASCTYVISEGLPLSNEVEALPRCEQELLDLSSCLTPSP